MASLVKIDGLERARTDVDGSSDLHVLLHVLLVELILGLARATLQMLVDQSEHQHHRKYKVRRCAQTARSKMIMNMIVQMT